MIKCVPTSEALNVQRRPRSLVHKANDGGGLWWMRLEPPSRGYIAISISSRHQIRLAAQQPSAFQNAGGWFFVSPCGQSTAEDRYALYRTKKAADHSLAKEPRPN